MDIAALLSNAHARNTERPTIFDQITIRRVMGGMRLDPVPSGSETPVVFYIHGGGWVVNEVDDYIGHLTWLAVKSHATIIAIDYTKAPRSTFPAQFDEVLDSITRLLASNERLKRRPLHFMGESAGAPMAAYAASRLILQHSELAVVSVQLLTPVSSRYSHRHSDLVPAPGALSSEVMEAFWSYVDPEENWAKPDFAKYRPEISLEPLRGSTDIILVIAEDDVLSAGNRELWQILETWPRTRLIEVAAGHGFMSWAPADPQATAAHDLITSTAFTSPGGAL